MKKILSILLLSFITSVVTAQVSKTLNLATAGTLSTNLTANQKTTITNLTLTGNIDARDVKCMRDEMTVLSVLNINAVTILTYIGTGGTYDSGSTTYPENEMPKHSFYKTNLKSILTGITLPTSLTSIGDHAFFYCTNLSGILTIPASVTRIGVQAFYKCSGFIGSLIIPPSMKTIASGAFSNCSGISGSLILPATLTSISDNAFYECSSISNLIFPSSLTSIGSYAFWNCFGLTNLTLPESLITIGTYAFNNCSAIKIINCLSAKPPTITDLTFAYVSATVYVPSATAATAYKVATGWSRFSVATERRVIVDNTTAGGLASSIVIAGLNPLNTITHLTVTGNLNSVDIESMKTNMTVLTEVDLSGAMLTSNAIPANAFQKKTTLAIVKLPTTITSIGDYAFQGCSSLSGSLPIGDAVRSIGNYAFDGCRSFSSGITLPTGLVTLGSYAFHDCRELSGGLILPSTLTSIGSNSFEGCRKLVGNIDIPSLVISVGSSAFSGCSGFDGSLTFQNPSTIINSYAFIGCSGLSGELKLPDSKTINETVFAGCSNLSGVLNIPLSVTSIGSNAFSGCNKLTQLNVSKNTSTIGDNAFRDCSGLTKISVPRATPPTIYANTFGGSVNKETCELEVPIGSRVGYLIANYWGEFVSVSETPSALSELVNNRVKIYATSSLIIVEGTTEGEIIWLYTVNGIQIQSIKSVGERIIFPVQSDAVYIVKTADKAVKVLM